MLLYYHYHDCYYSFCFLSFFPPNVQTFLQNIKKFPKFVGRYCSCAKRHKKFSNVIDVLVSEMLRLYERLLSYAPQIDIQLHFYQDHSQSTFLLLDPKIMSKLNASKVELEVSQFIYFFVTCSK